TDTDQTAFTANRIIHTNSGGTGLTDTANFVFDGTNLGIGTTTPWGMLSVAALSSNTSPIFTLSTSTASATSTALIVTSAGKLGLGTTSPYAVLSVAGDASVTRLDITNASATSTIAGGLSVGGGALNYDYSSGVTSVDNLNLGTIGFDTDAGQVTWVDLPVTNATASTTESYTAAIDGNAVLTIYGEADGAGGVNTLRVGIGTSSPSGNYGPLTMASGAYVSQGGVWTDASSRTLKENFTALDSQSVLQKIQTLDVTRWNYKSESAGTTHIGPVAEDFYAAFNTGGPGGTMSISPLDTSGVALLGIQAISNVIDIVGAGTTTPSIRSLYSGLIDPAVSIDADGNVGIGTTTPSYKLHVLGDVAATAFVNVSTRDAKKDITYIGGDPSDSVLDKFANLKVANYHYNFDAEDAPLRMGLIAEESPAEILAAGGKGIDLYKLSAFTILAVQEEAKKIQNLEEQLANLQGLSVPNGGISMDAVVSGLKSLGADIASGLATFKDIIADSITTGALTIKNADQTKNGITIYDRETGAPFCFYISGGVQKTEAGTCVGLAQTASVSNASSSPVSNEANQANESGSSDTEAPVITVAGNNPATVEKGTSYADLGATVTDNVNDNLGVKVEGDEIDTSVVGEYTVTYTATDQVGNVGTATRKVNVVEPVVPGFILTPESSTTATSNASTSTDVGTTTEN
ncbi:MAG: tail fiber domain-containing protein, partial [Candidatus Paceibacterota bacterium]